MLQALTKIFVGSRNDREVKKLYKRIKTINALESHYEPMNDEELKNAFDALRQSVRNEEKTLDGVLDHSFAITREASKRTTGLRHFDVQLIGGLVLHEGKIAEMKTGEGKTLVASLPACLNAMTGQGVHIITVNDYLAKRDAEDMGRIYEFLGYTTGAVVGSLQNDVERQAQYACDITYGTNNEFGFDYLRDNMKFSLDEKVQRNHFFAIVDEVDSILIDEARTPLIISGPTNRRMEHYTQANEIALKLEKGEKLPTKPGEEEKTTGDFVVDEKNKTVLLTEQGIEKAEKLFEVENLYSLENAALAHHLDQALKSNYIFTKDVDYVVKDNEVIIVDEFTGRLSEGRRFSEGLHQALEAKEGVAIKEESQTLADITFQNYFRYYKKLAGMTGTAQTEATEFEQIYSLQVISIPTNVPVQRDDKNDLIFRTEREKFNAVIAKIRELNEQGQPILVGTASIEKSELLHAQLKKEKIPHTVLNAKQHAKEAEIIKDAGKKGAVTIATNMAGRGVDIKIDDEIRSLGGLYIIGTERHESRRIDNQLRGRSGRQGDPGASQFYLSLEDNLLRIFGSDRISNIMGRLGIEEGEHIESRMVTKAVENAQKKVEGLHFESRKHLLEYDDVANEQRKVIYRLRNELLDKESDVSTRIRENRKESLLEVLHQANVIDGMEPESFDLEKLTAMVREDFNSELAADSLNGKEATEIEALLVEKLETEYAEKMSKLPEQDRSEIERILYLQVLDNSWRDHLYQMDILKTGIGLRSYNQKDPLVEYKKESYNLFMELVARIKMESTKSLHTVRFRTQEEQREIEMAEKLLRQMEQESGTDVNFVHSEAPSSTQDETLVAEKKIPRNGPCPCGSGKKYKYCCGQSGPKKGVLAS